MIRHTAPSLALGLCEPDHTAPACSRRRGAFEDQSHGRIVTRAKAYYLFIFIYLSLYFLTQFLKLYAICFEQQRFSILSYARNPCPEAVWINLESHSSNFEAGLV